MFLKIAGFEFRYQTRNPVFWVAAILFLLLAFGAVARDVASCSAARTRATTAVAKPSSQLRRQARGLRLQAGTCAAARPCHICTSSEV